MTPDRRQIFADKPRDPRPIIKPEAPRYGCILFALAFLAVAFFTLKPIVTDILEELDAAPPKTDRCTLPLPPAPDETPGDTTKAAPACNPQSWITDHDYPSAALRAGMQGTVNFVLDIDAAGRVTDCTVTASSGWELLDSRSCALLMQRAAFTPARDEKGTPIASTYSSRIRWEIPND
jgi:protein TonB